MVPAFGKVITVMLVDAIAEPQEAVVAVKVIDAVPAATPVTTPVEAFTVATAVLLLLQVPVLREVVLNVAVAPIQTVAAPLTVPAFGSGFTVIVWFELVVPQVLVTV